MRHGLQFLPGGTALLLGLAVAAAGAERWLWIGTYAQRGSQGIYAATFDTATGRLGVPCLAAAAENASFLALHPRLPCLYAVNETGRFEGHPVGAVRAFRLATEGGGLTELNRQPTGGAAPCHLAVDATGCQLVVANYSAGNVAVFPLGADGSLNSLTQLVQHAGSGPNRRRQERPHAHGVTFSPANRVVFVPDLGLDRLLAYRFDPVRGALAPSPDATGSLPPGSGPRHAAFHPDGTRLYVINELTSTVTTFAWEDAAERLQPLATVSALPAGWTNASSAAELAVHPNGKFLYTSNRGHDSLTVFALDARTRLPTAVQHVPCGGRAPRHFVLDPAGQWLLCAHQDSDTIAVFAVDPATGRLAPNGPTVAVPAPVCLLWRRD